MPSFRAALAAAAASLSLAYGANAAATLERRQLLGGYPAPRNNDFSCRSQTHPNPVVLLHGLGANYANDLNVLETNLEWRGFCTFAKTYGAPPAFPYVGGLENISESAKQIAAFINEVASRTGAAKVDLVGHSEGAFQSLYVPKFEPGVSAIIRKIVAIAPPTHGTDLGNLYDFAYIGGNLTRKLTNEILDSFGCPACSDLLQGGAAVERLNDGKPIKQPGNDVTVIISRHDELVTPVDTARVNEAGVANVYVQDRCPADRVGHIGEAYDRNVWALVKHALDPAIPLPPRTRCVKGMPY